MGGESRNNEGRLTEDKIFNEMKSEIKHMKPVYEGYFHMIHWVSGKDIMHGN